MCGISVIVEASASPRVTANVLRMHAPIRHRGPDGEGFLLFNAGIASRFRNLEAVPADAAASVAFAFRRLKIVDLSEAADQPMSSSDGKCWIVFNGEIYNFLSLRSELSGHGYVFTTSGDTEVVLAAYEQWGEECFKRLEGMWAIVVLDLRRKRIVASRDRFGIKPLYYKTTGGSLMLASEIRQILAVTNERRANPGLISRFLAGDRDLVLDETFFSDVFSVPPGCWFSIPLDKPVSGVAFCRYWDLDDFHETNEPIDYRASVERVAALMSEAVRSHSVADVRVGSLLSGGLDSSTLTMLLARQAGEPSTVPTFSFGFRNDVLQYSELPYVDTLVRKEQLLNYETTFSPDWVGLNAERVVNTLEEPPLAMPAFAQFRTFELCKQNDTTVVLDGQGSDEIFAGYPYHERLLLLDHLRHGRMRKFSAEIDAIGTRDSLSSTRLVAKAFVQPKLYDIAQAVRGRMRWIAPGYGNHRGPIPLNASIKRRASLVNRRLHHDVKWGNAKIILGYADKNAMHFSIEARVPYFDRRLIEYAFSLPAEFKVSAATRKRVLRDFARTILPAEITERTDRMGFATPDAAWLRGPLWSSVRDRLDANFMTSRCFDSRRLREFIDGFEGGAHGDHRAVWRIWMLAVWQQAFAVDL